MKKRLVLIATTMIYLSLSGCGFLDIGYVSLTFTSPAKGTKLRVGDTLKFDIKYHFGASAKRGPYLIHVNAQNHTGSTSDSPVLYHSRFETLAEPTGLIHAEYTVGPSMIKLSLPYLFAADLMANPGGESTDLNGELVSPWYDSIASTSLTDYYLGDEFAFSPAPGTYPNGHSVNVYFCASGGLSLLFDERQHRL
jgi:hypothetical protein